MNQPASSTFRTVRAPEAPDPLRLLTDGNARGVSWSAVNDLSFAWRDLLAALTQACGEFVGADRHWIVLRPLPRGQVAEPLTLLESRIVTAVLNGRQQKRLAIELGIACSTVSNWYSRGLAKLGLLGASIPLPLVVTAQAYASERPLDVGARRADLRSDVAERTFLSIPRLRADRMTGLTPVERDVMKLLLERGSRRAIVHGRRTSALTIACQLRSIALKLGVSGRYSLVHRAIELGWLA